MKETTAMPTILCVDDEMSILKSLKRLFIDKTYNLLLANSGQEALELMQQQAVHLIISDMKMPQMNGAEFLSQAARLQPDAYRILMTGYADLSSTITAINIGKIHRYVQKPWENVELLQLVNEGLEYFRLTTSNKRLTIKVANQNKLLKEMNLNLEEMVHQRTLQLKKTLTQLKGLVDERSKEHKSILEVLYNIISINPQLSGEFALNVAETSKHIAALLQLSKEQQQECYQAGLFCELGKLSFSSNMLETPWYKLDGNARAFYLQHPQHAEDMLVPATHLHSVSDMISQQYERFNGSGLPDKRVGTDIHIGARIICVARDFWSLIYHKLHPKKHSRDEAFDAIKRLSGSLYDPDVINVLDKLLHKHNPSITEKREQGLTVEKISVGMQLHTNLYNRKQMLLLPKGHIFTSQSLDKLKQYQHKHNEQLFLSVEPQTINNHREE